MGGIGMTDKQFDSYKKQVMRRLEYVLEEKSPEKKDKELQRIINDIQDELNRP